MDNKRVSFHNGFVTTERVFIGLSLVGLIVASLFLFNENLYSRFFGGPSYEDRSKPLMGVVTKRVNDTRYKSSKAIGWENARDKQNVRLGDSLFTGESSRSHVLLKDGNEMTLDQNTLVVFNENKMMDLGLGNFRFKVDGKLTFSIHGKTTVVEGKNSDIQIIVPKGQGAKPQVRLLQGKVNLQVQGQVMQNLTLQKLETLAIVKESERSTASAQESPRREQVSVGSMVESVQRHLRLYDVFELNEDKSLRRKSTLSEEAKILLSLDEPVNLTSLHSDPVNLEKNGTDLILSAGNAKDIEGYVFEVSRNKEFPADETTVKWTRNGKANLKVTTAGTFFYRVRGVNQKTELTALSEVAAVVVVPFVKIGPVSAAEPRRALAPLMIQRPAEVRKQRLPPAKVEKPQLSKKQVARKENSVPDSIRRPSAVANSSTKFALEERTNQGYSSSRIDFETGTFTVFSPDEKDVGRTNPYAYSLGIRSKHWFNERSGFEGIARVKAGGLNETADGINPLDIEARYHHKLNSAWFGSTNFSLLTGFEMYRNIGRGFFAQKYDLAKLGFALDFPVGHRWDAGGEVVMGMGADQTKKYEAIGRINYYFRRKYSLGTGYRLYLLEAGEKSAPLDLPYKETWGEGFFVFRWHY